MTSADRDGELREVLRELLDPIQSSVSIPSDVVKRATLRHRAKLIFTGVGAAFLLVVAVSGMLAIGFVGDDRNDSPVSSPDSPPSSLYFTFGHGAESATYTLIVDSEQQTVCYEADITHAISAYVYKRSDGSSSRVVSFVEPPGGLGSSECEENVNPDILEDLMANPESHYVQFHGAGQGNVLIGQVHRTKSVPVPEGCDKTDSRTYSKLPIGTWLEGLLLDVGAPGVGELSRSQILDAGGALWLSPQETGSRANLYIAAQRPPDLSNGGPSGKAIDTIGDFTVYFSGGDSQGYRAVSDEWQLGVLAQPGGPDQSSNLDRSKVMAWFREALDYAEVHQPPPCG